MELTCLHCSTRFFSPLLIGGETVCPACRTPVVVPPPVTVPQRPRPYESPQQSTAKPRAASGASTARFVIRMVMLALTCIWAAWVAWLAGSYLWQVGKTASDNREVAEIMLGMLPMILACPTALYALFMVPLFVLHFCIRPPTE